MHEYFKRKVTSGMILNSESYSLRSPWSVRKLEVVFKTERITETF